MNEVTPPPGEPEPVTGPVSTPPRAQPPVPPVPPQPAYVQPPPGQPPPGRLTKAALWVGIAAGAVFIVAVIFFSGVFVGKNLDGGPRYHHRGSDMVGRPGPAMFPMGPHGGFDRGPGNGGPFGSGGPVIDVPRQPGGPGAPTTAAPPRP
ncbi:hypothetical protein [Mycobacterium sp. ZZG]